MIYNKFSNKLIRPSQVENSSTSSTNSIVLISTADFRGGIFNLSNIAYDPGAIDLKFLHQNSMI